MSVASARAWGCYRAVLRAMVLSARREAIAERYVGTLHHGWLRNRVETWAADSRTTIPQLRTALEEAVETQPRPAWHAFSLKTEYLDWMCQLETMKHPDFYALQRDSTYRLGDMELPRSLVVCLYHARRFLLREPERSRQAIRLLIANWLGQTEAPEWQSRKPAVLATFRDATQTDRVPLYPVGPKAPAGARALSPRELDRLGVRHQSDRDESLVALRSPQGTGGISRAGGDPGARALSRPPLHTPPA